MPHTFVSALWVYAGVLDERAATSNNQAFDWVRSQSDTTIWVKRARWVEVISSIAHPYVTAMWQA